MNQAISRLFAPPILYLVMIGLAVAQDSLVLTSPAFDNGGTLPVDLRCDRHGGDGVSPPLAWSSVPGGTKSLALIMHHFPNGTVEGQDLPSQYWLLWNIPADTLALPRGNPASIGTEGQDKDNRHTGYTPPCSPVGFLESVRRYFGSGSTSPGSQHKYTITLYALNTSLDELPAKDSQDVDWAILTKAIESKIVASTAISFMN